jgi:hypothetical protein
MNHVKNVVLFGVKETRNILSTTKRRKSKWIGHFFPRDCLLKDVIEGNVEGMKRRRPKHLREKSRY